MDPIYEAYQQSLNEQPVKFVWKLDGAIVPKMDAKNYFHGKEIGRR